MQKVLQGCWSGTAAKTAGRLEFLAALFKQQQHAALFSSAQKHTPLNKSKTNLRKSGKHLGDKAEEILEKVVNLENNAPPPSPGGVQHVKEPKKPPQKKR
jgi:hypothetical protein